MKLIEVATNKDKRAFHNLPKILYKNDPFWVCPLDTDIEDIFTPGKNTFFQHGSASRWILYDNDDKLVGRVAAFINENKAWNFTQPTGGMGFFECINDQQAAFCLFDQCKSWLSAKGMKAMDGPVNFGENDRYWGLLTEGFIHPGYGMPYNFPYYKDLFESYGFCFYFEQVSNHLDLTKPFPERFWKIAEWITQKPGFSYRHFNFKDTVKFVNDFSKVYSEAWSFHENFSPITSDNLVRTLINAKSIIDKEFIWFAYYENEPIAFLVMFPDFNQVLKKLNGKINLTNVAKFYWLKHNKTITRARLIIMGVIPRFQKYGIESALFWHLDKVMKRKPHYKEVELSWVGDFNPKMRQLHESVGAVFAKKHITYRKLFEETVEFKRSSIIPVDTKEKLLSNNIT